jgi:hypothetical protein
VSEFSQAIERAAWRLRETVQQSGIRVLAVCGASSPSDSPLVTARLARDLQRHHGMHPLVIHLREEGSAELTVPGVEHREIVCANSQEARSDSILVSLAPMLAEAASHHDLVLIDAPPLLRSLACLQAVSLARQVLLLVEFGRTQEETVQQALQQLRTAGASLAGTLICGQRKILPGWVDRMLGA